MVPMIKAVIVPMIKVGMLSRDKLTYDVQEVQLYKYKYFILCTVAEKKHDQSAKKQIFLVTKTTAMELETFVSVNSLYFLVALSFS
jgi:hypothetical protein